MNAFRHLCVACSLMALPSLSAGKDQPSSAIETAERLYHDFAWEAVVEEPSAPSEELINQPPSILKQYFTEVLAQLLRHDRLEVVRTHDIGRLDFTPIWDSQDPAATALRITKGSTPDIVLVEYTYPGNKMLIHLSYLMKKSAAGWKIADICYKDGRSLVEILGGKRPRQSK